MKKSLTALTFAALALSATAIPGLTSKYSASAESKLNSSQVAPAASAAAKNFTATTQDLATGIVLPKVPIYALNTNNVILVLRPGDTNFSRLVRVTQANGNLIGIDFRPADNRLYALTDTRTLYTIALGAANLGNVTKISTMSPRFNAGYQSLMDFNPVVDAIRFIGSDNSNYAVVKDANGILNTTAVQTSLTYPAPDVNAGKDPNVACGSYNNNVAGATVTLFYGIDYALDTFVFIPPATPGGSSNTGGGQLQTIGNLVTPAGARINFAPTTDFDINTNANGVNTVYGVSGRSLFTIDMSQINPTQQRGQTKNVVVRGISLAETPDNGGNLIDIALPPR
ncbi:MAG TPA: DUF4394 domain-containing protein [Blastocatellia bacterium]|nr:DUF4394 domain-containing protein [Blastocatellia bacterium]